MVDDVGDCLFTSHVNKRLLKEFCFSNESDMSNCEAIVCQYTLFSIK